MADDDHPEDKPPKVETIDGETIDADPPSFDAEVGDGPVETPAEPTAEELLATEKDRVLRLQAELQNTLSRKSRELADERKYAGLALMKDILPVLDNIDRAIEAAEKVAAESSADGAGDASGLLGGFKMVRQQLATVLSQHRCEAIAAAGEAFNPDLHEAILQQPSPDHPAGAVVMETQTGYKLHDRVVRPSQVIVSSGDA
ncbi:MAG: nucleotide exchange factor GrpE [Planctomycetota bacterium]